MNKVLGIERRDSVVWLTLNRPDRLNALDERLCEDLLEAVAAAADDPEVRVVALTGAGRAFCAGGDVTSMGKRQRAARAAEDIGSWLDAGIAHSRRKMEITRCLKDMAKPTVAVLNGPAVGGGVALALSCDFRVMATTAYFRLGFRRMALPGDFGITYFLRAYVGSARARELLMLDDDIDAHRALALGLVTGLAEPDDLSEVAEAFVLRLAGGPTLALARMKQAIDLASISGLDAVLDREAVNTRLAALTNDSREAITAFLEKRAPRFGGK